MAKPILCVDFDGVIHSYTTPWQSADVIPDPPVPGAIAFLRAMLVEFDVQIYSSRSHQPGGRVAMMDYIALYGDTALSDAISFPEHKPSAFVTLDDRALTFNGTFPTIGQLRAFVPWNKRGPELRGISP